MKRVPGFSHVWIPDANGLSVYKSPVFTQIWVGFFITNGGAPTHIKHCGADKKTETA